MKKVFYLLMAAVMLVCSACGEQPEPVKEDVEEKVKVADLTIGNKSEDAFCFLMRNDLDQDITGFMIKTADQEEYPANMMAEGTVWSKDSVAEIYYIPETSLNEGETEKAVNLIYQAKIILADGNELELSSLGIEDIDGEAALKYEEEVAFVSYKSKLVGNEVSTKEQELGAKAQREAMEQAVQEEVVYEQPQVVYEEPSYTEPIQETVVVNPEPVPEAPVQSEEGCLTDVEILNP